MKLVSRVPLRALASVAASWPPALTPLSGPGLRIVRQINPFLVKLLFGPDVTSTTKPLWGLAS